MKKIYFLMAFTLLSLSCTDVDDKKIITEVTGTWKLIEVLADPGNGSGVYMPVVSNKLISFNYDGSVTSNGSLCNFSTESTTPSSGSFSTINGTIIPTNCQNGNILYALDGDFLILNYFCIEPCGQKFERVY